jgi:hypothetical protein
MSRTKVLDRARSFAASVTLYLFALGPPGWAAAQTTASDATPAADVPPEGGASTETTAATETGAPEQLGTTEPATDAGMAAPPPAPTPEPEPATALPPPRPPPYSVPFYLRPMPAINVVRLDTVFAPHDRIGNDMMGMPNSGLTLDVVQIATVGVRLADWAQIIARMGWDWTGDPGWAGVSNLILGGNFTWRIESMFRLSIFAALELPTGTDATGSRVHGDARMARLAMDNAMFVVDHLGGIVGAGFAYIDHGLTIQLDATLLAFGRVDCNSATPCAGDEGLVNSTFGLLVGYFIVPEFSVAGELHHQHFVSDPAAVTASPELRSQTSGTLGVRFHFQPVAGVWIRPAVSWSIGFDPPLATDAWQMFQLDIPVFF